MNIYYVSIHKDEKGTIHNIYYGEAETAKEAIDRACMVAMGEGCEKPTVKSCILEGKKSFG